MNNITTKQLIDMVTTNKIAMKIAQESKDQLMILNLKKQAKALNKLLHKQSMNNLFGN